MINVAMADVNHSINYDDFARVQMRVGQIVKVEDFPKARKPAFKLWIHFGEYGIKRSSAQIAALYNKDELVNRQVIAVTNFPPKQIADFISEVLVLGAATETGDVVLLQPERNLPLGSAIF